MTYKRKKLEDEGFLKKIIRYFIQGVLILAPIAITFYLLYGFFNWIDSILRPYVSIPGLGFLIILSFIILIGWVSSYIIMESAIDFLDHWLERTPGIKIIYTSIKDFFNAIAGDKKKFTRPVLANVFDTDVWIVGFLTDEEMAKFNMGEEMIGVYVPQAYNIAGQLYILPKNRVKIIEHLSAGDTMKYTLTGGVVETEEGKVH